jgi:hypothetical protein
MITILDEVKAEIIATEEVEKQNETNQEKSTQISPYETPKNP